MTTPAGRDASPTLRPARRDASAGFDRRLIVPMILGSVLNPINSSMLAVALIPIGAAFGAPPSQTAWLVSGLYLATAVGQPVIGRLVDAYGPKPLYLTGTALVGVAGLLGALAPSLGVLITARVLLGFGTSAAYPAAMYLIRREADRSGRQSPNGVLTALAVANQTINVVGPTLGGLLIGVGGWRAIFTINLPLAVACLILGTRRLPRVRTQRRDGPRIPDPAGMVLFAATLTCLLLFLMNPRPGHWYLLGGAAAAAASLTVLELRVTEPFLDLRVLGGNLPLLATYLRQVLSYITAYAFLYGYTQWLEDGRGLHASTAGLVMLPLSLSAVIVSAITGRRQAVRGKLVVGALFQLAGCATLLQLGGHSAIWLLLAAATLIGIPQGLNNLANQNALYHQADPARIGASSGLLRTFSYLGAMGASSANAAFFTHGAGTGGMHHLALFMSAAGLLLLTVTVADRSLGRLTRRAAR